MNKYFLYIETVDGDGDICARDFVDVEYAESLEECMKKTEWTGDDTDADEQYCVDEEDADGNYIESFYPFGEAKIIEEIKKLPKYSYGVMRNVRRSLDLEPNDTSRDMEINEMDRIEVLDRWLQWEGILGYTNRIKYVVDNIFYGK